MRKRGVNTGKTGLFIMLFALIIAGVSFGYAQLRETLTINGTAKIKSVSWNVNMKNLTMGADSVLTDRENTVMISTDGTENTKKEMLVYTEDSENPGNYTGSIVKTETTGGVRLDFNVTLKEPGKSFSFTFDVANDGTLDAVLKSIKEDGNDITTVGQTVTTLVEQKNTESSTPYFRYTVGGMPLVGSTLVQGAHQTVTITIDYPDLSNAADLPTSDYTFNKTILLNYEQKM